MDLHPVEQTAKDVANYPINTEAKVSSAWLENRPIADDEVEVNINLHKQLVMYRSMRKVVDVESGEIWTSGYRNGMNARFRVRDMTTTPKGVVQIIAILTNQLSKELDEFFRYTFATHNFNGMDLYKVHAAPSLIKGEPGQINPADITDKI